MTTSDPDHAMETLVCKGYILSPMRASPATVDFGRLRFDAPAQQKTIFINRGDGGPLDPDIKQIIQSGLDAEIREIEPGEQYALDVSISPPWPNGQLQTSLRLGTGVVEAPEAAIPVLADVEPRILVQPESILVPYLLEVREIRKAVRFTWADGSSHKLLRASVDDPEITARIDGSDGAQQVVLVVPPEYRCPALSRTVTVYTDDEQMPVVEVPVTFARPPAFSPRKNKTTSP